MVLPDELVEDAGPLQESVSTRSLAHQDGGNIVFATAGSKGSIRMWSSCKKHEPLVSLEALSGVEGSCDAADTEEGEGRGAYEATPSDGGYYGLSYCGDTRQLVGVTYDHNVVFYDTPSFAVNKQVRFARVVSPQMSCV